MTTARVSVLMTVYNAEKFLRPAIDSLLTQTYSDFEAIVIENGSNDASREIIESYNEPKLRVFKFSKNIGRTQALIKAFKESKGEFIAIQDADDLSLPKRLELQVKYMSKNLDVVLLGSNCDIISETGQFINHFTPPCKPTDAYQNLAFENIIMHSTAMFRRQVAIKAGGYPSNLAFAQDYGLWIKLAGLGKIANLPQRLALIRHHDQSLTNVSNSRIVRSLDVIECLETVLDLNNLSHESIYRNQANKTLEYARLSRSFFRVKKIMRGAYWTYKCIFSINALIIKLIKQKYLLLNV